MKKMRVKEKKEITFFDDLKRKISNKFYDFSQKIYEKTHKDGKIKKTRTMRRARRADLLFYASMIALPLLQWIIFYVVVHANSFFLAFKSYTSTGVSTWVGFDNFRRVWSDLTLKNSALINAFKNSLLAYALNFAVLPITILTPYYIYKKMPGSEFFKVMLFLPSILSGMVMSLLYQYIIDKVLPDYMMNAFGIKMPAFLSDTSTRFWAAWFYMAWFGMGSKVLLYTGTMSRIPVSVVESAKLDGCGPVREFLTITFPLIFSTASTYFIIGFSDIFTGQLGLYTFFGTNSQTVQTVGYYLYRTTLSSSGFENYPYASALGLFFTAFVAPLTLLLRHYLRKLSPSVDF